MSKINKFILKRGECHIIILVTFLSFLSSCSSSKVTNSNNIASDKIATIEDMEEQSITIGMVGDAGQVEGFSFGRVQPVISKITGPINISRQNSSIGAQKKGIKLPPGKYELLAGVAKYCSVYFDFEAVAGRHYKLMMDTESIGMSQRHDGKITYVSLYILEVETGNKIEHRK